MEEGRGREAVQRSHLPHRHGGREEGEEGRGGHMSTTTHRHGIKHYDETRVRNQDICLCSFISSFLPLEVRRGRGANLFSFAGRQFFILRLQV